MQFSLNNHGFEVFFPPESYNSMPRCIRGVEHVKLEDYPNYLYVIDDQFKKLLENLSSKHNTDCLFLDISPAKRPYNIDIYYTQKQKKHGIEKYSTLLKTWVYFEAKYIKNPCSEHLRKKSCEKMIIYYSQLISWIKKEAYTAETFLRRYEICRIHNDIVTTISDNLSCESPIEKILYDKLKLHSGILSTYNIIPQQRIGIYRVDFLLLPQNNIFPKIVIECDGHEFHEKTAEQASRDKQRDRELIRQGYIVCHFTGKEIYGRTSDCVSEIAGIINKWRSILCLMPL